MFATFLATLGLHAVFASTSIQSYICQPPSKPSIVAPLGGSTVDAGAVQVQGTATASSTVTLSVDGQNALSVTADQSNAFAGQLTLATGSHQIGISVASPCGNSTGDPITVTAITPPPIPTNSGGTSTNTRGTIPSKSSQSNSAPTVSSTDNSELKLTVSDPQDGSTIRDASAYIIGSTNEPATIVISVGGEQVANTLVAGTSFGLSVPLKVGDNLVQVVASSGGQQASVELHLVRAASSTATTQGNRATTSTPWYRTAPAIVAMTLLVVISLGAVVWFIR